MITTVSISPQQLVSNKESTGYTGLFKNSAGNLYFVTLGQFGAGASFGLMIWKSTDAGVTWNRIVSDANRGGAEGFAAVLIGDVIHFAIVNANYAPNSNLGIYRFDTIAELFLADDYGGPHPSNGPAASYITATALSDGSITMSYISDGAGTPAGTVNWLAGVWGAPVLMAAQVPILCPAWAIKEVTTERIHFFLLQTTPGSTNGIAIWHVSQESNGTLNALTSIVSDATKLSNLANPIGAPCIFGADTQIILPFTWGPPDLGANNVFSIRVVRATPGANPVWTNEEAVPANAFPGTELEPSLDFAAYFGVSAIDQTAGITLIFSVDNNPVLSANLQGWLYTTSTTLLAGGWGVPVLLFTDPAGSTNTSTYGLKLSGTTYGVVVGTATPPSSILDDLRLWFIGSGAGAPVKTCLQLF